MTNQKKPKLPRRTLVWRRDKNTRMSSRERGWSLYLTPGQIRVAFVAPQYRGFGREIDGYGAGGGAASLGVDHFNTFGVRSRFPTGAMTKAERFVIRALKKRFQLRVRRPKDEP